MGDRQLGGREERRRHRRFNVSEGAFAALTSPSTGPGPVGQLVDLGRGGVSFRYFSRDDLQLEPKRSLRLAMVTSDQRVYLDNLPVRIVFDKPSLSDVFPTVKTRRCGVQFGGLTDAQESEIERLLRGYTGESGSGQPKTPQVKTEKTAHVWPISRGHSVPLPSNKPLSQNRWTLKRSADSKPKARGETVLIVEDEAALLEVCESILDGLGYTVLTAARAGEALDVARKYAGEIDLLITDVFMPEMNGKELADAVKRLGVEIKVLFMSGYAADSVIQRGILDAGLGFVQKPFTTDDLARKVREVLDE